MDNQTTPITPPSVAYPPEPTTPRPSRYESTKKVFGRLGEIGSFFGKIFSFVFYIIIISAFLGAGGLFGSGQERTVKKLYGEGESQIAVFDIAGVLMESSDSSNSFTQSTTTGSRELIELFEDIKNQEEVKAIIIRINSPGGSVTAAEEMYQTIIRYKKELNIPVVISMSDTAASGGYYIALAGDYIYANDTTLTGSIGAIIQTYNIQELADRYGVKNVIVASGRNKDLLNPFKPVDEEQRQLLQTVVDEAYRQFLTRIQESRPVDSSLLSEVADGRVMSGAQAKSYQLIDQTGSFHDVVTYVRQQIQASDAQVVVFGQKGFLDSLLGSLTTAFSLRSQLPLPSSFTQLSGHPAYLYLN